MSTLSIESKFLELGKALTKVKATRKASYAELEGVIGLNKTQISDIINGNLVNSKGKRNISDALVSRLYAEYVEKQAPISISTFELMTHIAVQAQERAKMMCVVGRTGAGKSTAMKALSESKEGVYYVLCSHLDDAADLMDKIWLALGQKLPNLTARKRRKYILEGIKEWAGKQESKPLLILDDIHYQSLSAYQDLKLLCDYTLDLMGILFVGTEVLETKLKRWAGYDNNWNQRFSPRLTMPEFLGRFRGHFYNLDPLSKEDIKKVCAEYGITDRKVVEYFFTHPALDMRLLTDKLTLARELSITELETLKQL